MSGSMNDGDLIVSEGKGVAVLEEEIELTAVRGQVFRRIVEDLGECLLHRGDVGTDSGLGIGILGLQVLRSRQVIGVHVTRVPCW